MRAGSAASARRKRKGGGATLREAPVAQWKSVGLLSRWSQVRILPGPSLTGSEHPVARLVTFADLDGDPADARELSVSARLEAELGDGRRLVLLDGRGWTASR